MWLWIMIGLGCFLALSLLAAITLAATLGAIGRKITDLHADLHGAPRVPAPASPASGTADEVAGAEPETAGTPALRLHAQ